MAERRLYFDVGHFHRRSEGCGLESRVELFKGRLALILGYKLICCFVSILSRGQSIFNLHKIKHLLIHTRSVRTKFQHS